jgi:hypothetical protein
MGKVLEIKITSIGLCHSEGNFESKHPQLHLRWALTSRNPSSSAAIFFSIITGC